MRPPFIPKLDNDEDTKYIEEDFLKIVASEKLYDDEGLKQQREDILKSKQN
jgi:hypothetical protein